MTGVQTRILQFLSLSLYPLHHEDTPLKPLEFYCIAISNLVKRWKKCINIQVLILLYECTTWTLVKHVKKKLNSYYTRMLQAVLNKSCRQHPTKQQLYGHLPPIMKTIQVKWTRHVVLCWRIKDKLISKVLLWTTSYGQAKVGQPARTYLQQLSDNTGCSLEDLQGARDDRDG